MRFAGTRFQSALCLAAYVVCVPAFAENGPVLTWITNSSVKLEQIIGDKDWADAAKGANTPTVSLTVTRFHILGNGLGYSFEHQGKLIFLFGDTISEDVSNRNYHAADPLAWSTNRSGETGLFLTFYTNSDGSPLFVQPPGIKMGPDAVPNSGISLNNQIYLTCNVGSDTSDTNNPHAADYSVLVTFNETNSTFTTNRAISTLNTNLDPRSPMQGHFIINSLHAFGTNVLMFGLGEYRATDVYLSITPTNTFVSGIGILYFAGLTNGQPTWAVQESNAVPVMVDNPTNGPAWPNDYPSVGNVSVTYSQDLGLWLMTYDGGRQIEKTTGVYFSYASFPWGPWSQPQLIFQKKRDHGLGVFIHDASSSPDDGLDGPTIGSNPTNTTAGGDFAPITIERFTTVTNSTLLIYYTMSTWNPYTVVKMRSAFTIIPLIDASAAKYSKTGFIFAWIAPTNDVFQVDFSGVMPPAWTTFTNLIASTNGTFKFTDDGSHSGGLGGTRFYRLRTAP